MPSGDGVVSFPFINTTPGLATDSAHSRLLVRSHVSSWIWQQTRQSSRMSDTNVVNDGHTQGAERSTHRAEGNTMKPEVDTSIPPSTVSCQSPDLATDTTSSRGNGGNLQDLPRSNNLLGVSGISLTGALYSNSLDCIGLGVFNPFQTYPLNSLSPVFVHWCIKYFLSIILPGLMPRSLTEPNSAAILSWFQVFRLDSTLFTVVLFGAVSHKRLYCLRMEKTRDIWKPQHNNMLIFLELEAIKRVNEAIQDPSRALSDAVIICVMGLVNNGGSDLTWDENPRLPFQSPLRDLQWLDVYGRLMPNSVHVSGLAQLVKLRGGLEHIKLPGLAPILSHSDILAASKTLSRPLFPFIPLGDSNPTLQNQLGLGQTGLNYGFMHLCEIGFTAELAEVFQIMKVFISIIEKYHDGSTTEPDLCRISNQRNFVQHHLLSLPPAAKLGRDFRKSHPVYETCRLAALVFSVSAVFPLPAQTAPLSTLVSLLHVEMQDSSLKSDQRFPDVVRVLIWALILGGIAATGLPNRAWFVAALAQVSANHGLSEWQDLRPVLDRMLWLDSAYGITGQQLWKEVCRFKLSKLRPG